MNKITETPDNYILKIREELKQSFKRSPNTKFHFTTQVNQNTFHLYWDEEDGSYNLEIHNNKPEIVGLLALASDFESASNAFIFACEKANADKFFFPKNKDNELLVNQLARHIAVEIQNTYQEQFVEKQRKISEENENLDEVFFVDFYNSPFCRIEYNKESYMYRIEFTLCPELGISFPANFAFAIKVKEMIESRLAHYLPRFSKDPLFKINKSGKHYSNLEMDKFREEIAEFCRTLSHLV